MHFKPEQTLWCLLVVPMIREVILNGEKQADVDVSSLLTCICPDANVQACWLGTHGLRRIGRDLSPKHRDKSKAGHSRISMLESHGTCWQANVASGCTGQGNRYNQRRARIQEGYCDSGLMQHTTLQEHTGTDKGAEVPAQASLCPCNPRTLKYRRKSHCLCQATTLIKCLRGQNASLRHKNRSLVQLLCPSPRN